MAALPAVSDFSHGLLAVAGISDLFWVFFMLVALQPVVLGAPIGLRLWLFLLASHASVVPYGQ
jgi:hypothetical protein